MSHRQLQQARNIKQLADKMADAAEHGREQLAEEYAVELELAITEVVNEIEEHHHQLDGSLMTREEDQLLRESDERASFNDHLDNLRNER